MVGGRKKENRETKSAVFARRKAVVRLNNLDLKRILKSTILDQEVRLKESLLSRKTSRSADNYEKTSVWTG